MASEGQRYSSVAVVLHWVIAILIIGQIAGGLFMHKLPNTSPIKFELYQLHKSFGVTIVLLTIARLGWRIGHKPPALPSTLAAWEKFAARTNHWLFYLLLILTPLAGWAMVSVSPTEVPTRLFGAVPWPHLPFFDGVSDRKAVEDMLKERHELLAKLILALLTLHVAAALKHHLVTKDMVLKNMVPHSAAQGLGIAGILGVVMVASAFYWTAPDGNVAVATIETSTNEAPEGNWIVDMGSSRFTFTGSQKGRLFEGEFADFEAAIKFDPDNLEASSIDVTVMTATATTGDQLRDSELPGKAWFSVKDHPTARFVSGDIVSTGEGAYEARGQLTIKEFTKDVALPFTLVIVGDQALAQAELDLIRTEFGLGTEERWFNEEGISVFVTVKVEINARRATEE